MLMQLLCKTKALLSFLLSLSFSLSLSICNCKRLADALISGSSLDVAGPEFLVELRGQRWALLRPLLPVALHRGRA